MLGSRRLLAGTILLGALAACGGGAISKPLPTPAPVSGSTPVPLALSTGAFPDAGEIPVRYSCDGDDISPDLSWNAAPTGTETFTVIMDDPDAPGGTWVHWMAFNIPGDKLGLSENQPKADRMPGGGLHGKNSWGNSEYGGPCPPGGPGHTYRFFLYAVDTSLDLPAGASRQQVGEALSGHVLAEGRLAAIYGR